MTAETSKSRASRSGKRAAMPSAAACAAVALTFILPLSPATTAPTTTATAKATTNTITPPPRRDVPGARFSLPMGNLYVPSFFDPARGDATDIVVFFHGAAWCAEQNFFDARRNAVLVSISLGMPEYARVFCSPDALQAALDSTTGTLEREGVTTRPLGRLVLASFSGGYSAVREILRHGRFNDRITDAVLADSLYAGRVEGKQDTLKDEDMAPFLNFARRAADGKCALWFSQLYPPEPQHRGNTTTLAANYLIERTGAKKRDAAGTNSAGAKLLYRADKGGLHILGYSGMTNQDHFNHFYALCDLLRETSIPPAEAKP